jgi:endonuclease/exonuclease/phosphatase family metal-dependent hydrolase
MVKQEATNYGKNLIICGDFNSTQFSLPYRILHKGLNDSFICKGIGLGSTHSFFNYALRLDFFLTDQRIKS